MTVTFSGESFSCTRAVRTDTKARLYLTDGTVMEFAGVGSWDLFSLEGGTWSTPPVTPEEQLRADIDFIAAMTGVML